MKKGAAHGWRIVGISFLLSVILSAAVIFIANDVFAFVSDTGEKTVTIPENATAEDVSSILKQNGLIRFPFIYRLYAFIIHIEVIIFAIAGIILLYCSIQTIC